MLGLSNSGGTGFSAKVYPHRYGYVGRIVDKGAPRLPQHLSEEDRYRIGLKVENGDFEDVLEDIRLSEGAALYSLDKRAKSQQGFERRHGQGGMTRRARHTVRASITALGAKVPEGCLSFFTATCPELDYLSDGKVAANWSVVVNIFMGRVRRLLKAAGVPVDYCHVTEIQPKRWQRTGRPYLHLHLVFRGRMTRRSAWACSYEQLREAWLAALNSVVDEDPFYLAVCDLRPCDRSIGKYLSKYLSKGGAIAREVAEAGMSHWFPRQWWGCSRGVVAEREKLTFRARAEEAQELYRLMRAGGGSLVEWLHPVEIEDQGGRRYTVGWCFGLTEAAYAALMTSGVRSLQDL